MVATDFFSKLLQKVENNMSTDKTSNAFFVVLVSHLLEKVLTRGKPLAKLPLKQSLTSFLTKLFLDEKKKKLILTNSLLLREK